MHFHNARWRSVGPRRRSRGAVEERLAGLRWRGNGRRWAASGRAPGQRRVGGVTWAAGIVGCAGDHERIEKEGRPR
jgi:hypothetical protein